MATRLKLVTATGLALAGPLYLKSVHLAAGGAAAATALVQDSAAGGGTDVLSLAAPIGGGDGWTSGDKDGVYIAAGVYVTLAGADAEVSVEMEK